jgi:hypothetical protein
MESRVRLIRSIVVVAGPLTALAALVGILSALLTTVPT